MADFQLILLSEVDRTAIRKARHSGAFPLTQNRSHSGVVVKVPYSKIPHARPIQQDDGITAEELATWYTPKEASAYAVRMLGVKNGTNAIWQRLVAGQIQCAATHSSLGDWLGVPQAFSHPTLIPDGVWKHLAPNGSDLWGAGDANFFLASPERGGQAKTFHAFGIKLNPRDVHATLPPVPAKQERAPAVLPATPIEKPEIEDLSQKGPAVSEEHLKAWFDLYRQVYSGAVDTEANALASARGMFPGKSVSRDRVRALRGTQKRGPKGSPAK